MLTREQRRLKIKARVRGKVHGTPDCPRLSVFRSNKQIYAQVIDDTTGRTLASASSLKIEEKLPKKEIAAKVGDLIAKMPKRPESKKWLSIETDFFIMDG